MRYLLIFLLALGITTAEAKSPPPGTGTADVPANILLMVDTSGSMAEVLEEQRVRYPMDVAFDRAGNIYVAKYYDTVSKYDPEGNYLLQWGGSDGSDADGMFDNTYSIAIDSRDRVYVADYNHARVQVFDTSGNFLGKIELDGSLAKGIAIDSRDNLYAINGNGKIEKYNSSWTKVATWNTDSQTTNIAVDATDNIYTTVYSRKRIERRDVNGNLLSSFSVSYQPMAVEIDKDGYLIVTDYNSSYVYKYRTNGTRLATYGGYGSGLGQFKNPRGIGRDPVTKEVYVTDYGNHRIQSPTGTLLVKDTVETRLDILKDVLKTITSDSDLTSGANFGLMQWNTSARMEVNVSYTGAQQIYNTVDNLRANGNTRLDNAMILAQSYLLGASSPIDAAAPCQQTIMIVLSDGFWEDYQASNIAETMNTGHGIRTFTVGFQTTGNANYVTLSQKGGTYPDSPLYANNKQNLLDVLSNYIRQIISAQLTFSTPTIIPGVTNEDSILQSTFTYQVDHQWKGRFLKYGLLPDGSIGDLKWDAGDILNKRTADSRKIWSVGDGLSLPGYNNFNTGNLNSLRDPMTELSGMGMTDLQVTNLINFVRGKDTYAEYPSGRDSEGEALVAGERWKLADIYHSRAVVVGKPSAYTSDAANENSEANFRYFNNYNSFRNGSSCGGSCKTRKEMVYVGSNGGMLHAFESSTGNELWSFIPPSVLPHLKEMVAAQSGKSLSIYGVDGSPVVKDIILEGEWRTVLMAGLRQGGHSYFALDVTNPDEPKHLFTIAYEPLDGRISYWNANGNRTDIESVDAVPSTLNFRDLGEAWSTPLIMRLPLPGGDKWVAVLGGGFNNAINPDQGARIFILDLEDGGRILEKISISDNYPNNIQTSVPPRLTAVSADTTTLFKDKGALIYFNDLEGKMWKVNLTNKGVLYQATPYFNTGATFENDRMTYHETTASVTPDGHLMQYFGTGDIQRVGRVDPAIANKAFGIRDTLFPAETPMSMFGDYLLQNMTASTATCPTDTQYGWFINLLANERITASATIKNGAVFLPRYLPSASAVCSPGTGSLTEVDFLCGNGLRTTELGAGMPTEVLVYKNKIYIGISSDTAAAGQLPAGFVKKGNLIVGDPVRPSPGKLRVESWREE